MNIELVTEHHFEFLSLTGGCTGLSESTLVKMPHCWKSNVMAQIWIQSIDSSCFLLSSGFDELTCTCGAEVLLPPIPCGTKPPECSQPCSREHSCNHPGRL